MSSAWHEKENKWLGARYGRFVVRRAGRAARMMGSLSADQRALPDFLIVGTQRGGTTSLFKALLSHPNFMPPGLRKGVHYFDVDVRREPALVPRALPADRARSPSAPTSWARRSSPARPARTTCATRPRPTASPRTCPA